ncbi:hypothetical protein ABKV19_004277 [Rosa sericea]
MAVLQSHRAEMLSIAVAVVAIGVGTAYYFYVTRKPKGCLDPEKFKEFKLVKRTQLSHNVAKFKFALPTATSVFGLPIGQHISCRGRDSLNEEVIKAYTPTTLDTDVGYFELVIKMYPQGRMSHHFRVMSEGDYLAVKGPKGRFKYQPNQVRAFGMLAGGTGITPMFQVARAIMENPSDRTNVHLIYGNVTYEDILLKEELDNLAINFPNRFNIYYVLNQVLFLLFGFECSGRFVNFRLISCIFCFYLSFTTVLISDLFFQLYNEKLRTRFLIKTCLISSPF